jgi:hypothetical protein
MPLPVKALRYGLLKAKTAGLAVPTSGHAVIRVEFEDVDGQTKSGFFKELVANEKGDGDYPELLAKYSVAASVLFRLALGDRAAEDRLVFDDKGCVRGTISIALDKFKPLYSSSQTLPLDPQEKELVCPSVETLLKHNVAELLVSAWGRMKCDDRHPGNFSLFGLIDWDMALYPYTYMMKGGRLVDGIIKELPDKGMKLLFKQISDFPNIEGRTHFPTNSLPGNGNVLKRFQSYAEFQKLASNPAIRMEEGEVSWQEQFFTALLKELLAFDPKMLRARLKEYLGEELLLDYLSLPPDKSAQLEKAHPQFFQKSKDKGKFIDHIMDVFQHEYKEFYNAVVFYPGCVENKSGVGVPGFHRFLRNKSSAFKKIVEWMTGLNKKMEQSWSIYLKRQSPAEDVLGVLDAYTVPPESRYNIKRVQQCYHQIWRDAHGPTVTAITDNVYSLIKQLANNLGVTPSLLEVQEVEPNSTSGAESFQLLGKMALLTESYYVEGEGNNQLKEGLKALKNFLRDLKCCAKNYYEVACEDLNLEHNQAFCDTVSKLIRSSEKKVLPFLSGNWACEFGDCIKNLQQFYNGLHFGRHLIDRDVALNKNFIQDYSALLTRPHTDEEVIQTCLKTLFSWVQTLDSDTFNSIISGIIKASYQPTAITIWAQRHRGPRVEAYLKKTKDNCANRLATILSEGGTETTSLNTLIIRALVPMMLEATQVHLEMHLLSVRSAIEHHAFRDTFYAQKAQSFVKTNPEFMIVTSKGNMERFSEIMYTWATQQDEKRVRNIVRQALGEYQPSSPWFSWGNKQRKNEVEAYLQCQPQYKNDELLTLIFTNGRTEASSLNTILLKKILEAMKGDLNSKKKPDIADFDLVDSILPEHLLSYSQQLQGHSKFIAKRISVSTFQLC